MMRVVAVVGLSGVGKSTLVGRLSRRATLTHLQSSHLIKEEQARRSVAVSSSEELRVGPVLDNQQLLIEGFRHAARGLTGLVVFDGHAVIFDRDHATEIPAAVFGALGCDQLVMIGEDPGVLRQRRAEDARRYRPDVGVDELSRQQAHLQSVASRIADALGIPFHRVHASDFGSLSRVILEDGAR